ncbi:MAG TPA: hypothetical protein VMT01_01595 [Candidatus Acidoferrum sp.]|jgi:hypothetical protein|nr:hypothetical protein [Candidatus Acidoferrum sp.]
MPARKMRVEVFDAEGNRYTVAFEGQITRDKAVRLLDLVELLGGMPAEGKTASAVAASSGITASKYDKMQVVVSKHFPITWFASREIQAVYEQEYNEPISLSTVATYLGRMADRNMILKAGASNSLKYRLAGSVPQAVPKQRVP